MAVGQSRLRLVWAEDCRLGEQSLERRAVGRSLGGKRIVFNEPAGCRAERRTAEWGRHYYPDASIARRRKGFGCGVGVGRLFSVDPRGAELCNRRFGWRASLSGRVLGDWRGDPQDLTSAPGWVVRFLVARNGLNWPRVGSASPTWALRVNLPRFGPWTLPIRPWVI